MKLAVIGSRGLNVEIEAYLPKETTIIISGVAKGIDTLAEEYADKNGIAKLIFLPEYERFGKSAPIIRNKKIVEEADFIVALWDGKSRGTKFTIEYARKRKKPVRVFLVSSN